MNDQITIRLKRGKEEFTLEAPTSMNLNLMEVLKANEINGIEGACGGMALCATCHVRVQHMEPESLTQADDELAMLDTLPEVYENSRLACQIKITEQLKELSILLL